MRSNSSRPQNWFRNKPPVMFANRWPTLSLNPFSCRGIILQSLWKQGNRKSILLKVNRFPFSVIVFPKLRQNQLRCGLEIPYLPANRPTDRIGIDRPIGVVASVVGFREGDILSNTGEGKNRKSTSISLRINYAWLLSFHFRSQIKANFAFLFPARCVWNKCCVGSNGSASALPLRH